MNTEKWSVSTQTIFNGVLIFAICGVLRPIFDFVRSVVSMGNTLSSIAGGSQMSGTEWFLKITVTLLLIGIIYGYYMYMKGLQDFSTILEPADSQAILKVRTAAMLILIGFGIALLFSWIPFAGWFGRWVAFFFYIIAYIFMIMGFSSLKSSSTFNHIAKKGAEMLFVAAILLLVAVVVNIIPFIGGILNIIVSIVAYIMVFIGWAKIKSAAKQVA
ncbi:MAG: hypothetical protein FWE63_06855 [Bacteroidales bacterium]|nr:hypothetical protein [Bacteroidales bacterium]